LIFKASEIFFRYATDTFRFVFLSLWGNPESEIDKWYFNLHFYNFFMDIEDYLNHVHKWPQQEKEDFVKFLNETGMASKVFRFPRGSSEPKEEPESEPSEDSDNEHYDLV
jgi:hypothetical protein